MHCLICVASFLLWFCHSLYSNNASVTLNEEKFKQYFVPVCNSPSFRMIKIVFLELQPSFFRNIRTICNVCNNLQFFCERKFGEIFFLRGCDPRFCNIQISCVTSFYNIQITSYDPPFYNIRITHPSLVSQLANKENWKFSFLPGSRFLNFRIELKMCESDFWVG